MTFVKMFCKFTVVWSVFDVVAMFGETLWKLFPCMSDIQDLVLGTLCSVNYFPFLAVSSTFFSVMFNLSLVMSLNVFICRQSLHFPQGVTLLGCSCWYAILFFKRCDLKGIVFSVGDSRFLFENFWRFRIAID